MVSKEIGDEYPDLVRSDWLKLMFYFEHERDEGEITAQTYESMTRCLMTLKNYLPNEEV